jgi:hypothetical protein
MASAATSLERLDHWIEGQGFRGWDPHDALNSPWLHPLTFGNRWLAIAFVQAVKRSRWNLRPLLRVPKTHNPKAMGLFLETYLRRCDFEQAWQFAEWLRERVSPGYHGACWGYPFDWPNRSFYAPAGTPTAVNTAFIGLAFLELHRAQTSRETLETARSACEFLLRDLHLMRPAGDELCFSYTPLDRRRVHNANLLAGRLLAETYVETGEPELAAAALAAARYTTCRQRPDGAWPYGEACRDAWVDNFHTGFVLVALRRIAACLQTEEFCGALARGYDFWKRRFFLPGGVPKYYPDRTYPADAHCVAQAILTFLEFGDRPAALQTAQWSIEHMQDPEGWFHYQIHRRHRIRIPYLRWSQAWMQRALTELVFRSPYDFGSGAELPGSQLVHGGNSRHD